MFLGWQGILTFVGVVVVIISIMVMFAKIVK
jgi:hypothetical protein